MTFIKKIVEYCRKLWYDVFNIDKQQKDGVIDMAKYNRNLENVAKDILVKNDMLKIPVNLIEIATKNNIEIYYKSLPKGISGAIRYNQKEDNFQILIEETEPSYRKRFTLAHELSHFFLQKEHLVDTRDIHYDILYRNSISSHEVEIDYLAGAILMEESIVRRLFEINPSIKELSRTFNVSESAMTVRLMQLELI